MEKRTILQITNVNKLNNLKKEASFRDCIEFVLTQDFKFNKYIKPDTLELLKNYYESFKISFKNDFFSIENQNYDVSYQLKCEYYILKYLNRYLEGDLHDHFFEEDAKYGNISKNIKVEVTKPGILDKENRYRVDIELTLPNKYKIIIEVNEKNHEDEGKKINELNRARQILDDDKKICKFYILRELFIEKNYKNLRHFIKNILIREIKEIDKLHNERDYVITKLVELTYESWKPICELIYDSHLKPNEFVISVNNLNHFFEVNWESEFLNIIDNLTGKEHEDNDEKNDILSEEEDILDDEDELDLETVTQNNSINETKENYYKVIDEEIKLTWKGFNTYLTFVVKYMSAIDKIIMLNNFNYKIHTEFINIIKEQRNNLIELSESQKIWGYKDDDYNYINNLD